MQKQEHKHRPNKISCSRAYCTLQSTRCTFLRLTSACSYSCCCCWYLQYHCIMYKYLLLNTPPSFITRNGNERRKFPHSWTCCNLSTVDDARPSVRPSTRLAAWSKLLLFYARCWYDWYAQLGAKTGNGERVQLLARSSALLLLLQVNTWRLIYIIASTATAVLSPSWVA